MSRDDAIVLDILKAARRAVEGLGHAEAQQIEADWKLQAIVLYELVLMGEAVKRLSEEFRLRYPLIPWKEIAGTRDRIIHHYDRIDYAKVAEIVRSEIPPLISFLESL